MSSGAIQARAVMFMAVVFLALVAVHIWWGPEEQGRGATEGGVQVSGIQIAEAGRRIDLIPRGLMTRRELEDLMDGRIRQLQGGLLTDRRATAILVAYMASDRLGHEKFLRLGKETIDRLSAALLAGLNDADEVISTNCRKALIGLWRMSASATTAQHFSEGLSAYDAGEPQAALAIFNKVEELGGAMPPDLYRLRAEIYLDQPSPDLALAECVRALKIQPRHFLALYTAARAHVQAGRDEKAVEALDLALAVCGRFPEAEQLREQIAARTESDIGN